MVTFSPAQVCVKIGTAGKSKCCLPAGNMFVRAFLAGAYIAMGAALATVGSTGVADILGAGIAQFVLGALFPIGLILVVLTGAELFTGDAMFAPMAILQGHTGLKGLIYLWVVVYIGNLVGSLFMAVLVSYGPYTVWDAAGVATLSAFGTRAIAIATAKVSYFGPMGILSVFFKGILCNWLVCLALFLGLAADDVIGKMAGVWFPIMAFVASGFEHCVANMYFIPAGIITNMIAGGPANIEILNWGTMWTNNIIWSTLGNIVGAAIFMAVIYSFCYKSEICALCEAK
ncbi:formate/nitrite transporter family protein [Methanocorpusculum sp. MG]|uniref:Formate/nitrite transporter family protein n=1 Tax=Methanocorpusculum petauri TaxID=3002863 RepID=A0ABT4IF88_9EURY|nr:formate/nitrite transporter family protein [Methanocorpusculum petauri]MCZ0860407.1 formate/nitrite transporter family protein [Methanocorpusculum petauri]MDE2443637.1 formate/nitrite transporter family protein [Methanocorpusculum sp.]